MSGLEISSYGVVSKLTPNFTLSPELFIHLYSKETRFATPLFK